jgi:hypothetical protein
MEQHFCPACAKKREPLAEEKTLQTRITLLKLDVDSHSNNIELDEEKLRMAKLELQRGRNELAACRAQLAKLLAGKKNGS